MLKYVYFVGQTLEVPGSEQLRTEVPRLYDFMVKVKK